MAREGGCLTLNLEENLRATSLALLSQGSGIAFFAMPRWEVLKENLIRMRFGTPSRAISTSSHRAVPLTQGDGTLRVDSSPDSKRRSFLTRHDCVDRLPADSTIPKCRRLRQKEHEP
jgi:hypothetical protein